VAEDQQTKEQPGFIDSLVQSGKDALYDLTKPVNPFAQASEAIDKANQDFRTQKTPTGTYTTKNFPSQATE
jgi:hypothetical protein